MYLVRNRRTQQRALQQSGYPSIADRSFGDETMMDMSSTPFHKDSGTFHCQLDEYDPLRHWNDVSGFDSDELCDSGIYTCLWNQISHRSENR